MNLKISLQFNPDSFREIFYRNDQHLLHRNRRSKPFFYMAIVTFILFVVCLTLSGFNFGMMTQFLFLCTLVSEGILLSHYFTLRRWRKSVERFITKTGNEQPHELVISDAGFELTDKTQSTFEKWSQVVRYTKNESYIDINTDLSHYLFPMKSMTKEEFQQFTEALKNNILENTGTQATK